MRGDASTRSAPPVRPSPTLHRGTATWAVGRAALEWAATWMRIRVLRPSCGAVSKPLAGTRRTTALLAPVPDCAVGRLPIGSLVPIGLQRWMQAPSQCLHRTPARLGQRQCRQQHHPGQRPQAVAAHPVGQRHWPGDQHRQNRAPPVAGPWRRHGARPVGGVLRRRPEVVLASIGAKFWGAQLRPWRRTGRPTGQQGWQHVPPDPWFRSGSRPPTQ